MKKLVALATVLFLVSFNTYQEPKKLRIDLTAVQVELILKALSKLPYEESAETIASIFMQAKKQTDSVKTK